MSTTVTTASSTQNANQYSYGSQQDATERLQYVQDNVDLIAQKAINDIQVNGGSSVTLTAAEKAFAQNPNSLNFSRLSLELYKALRSPQMRYNGADTATELQSDFDDALSVIGVSSSLNRLGQSSALRMAYDQLDQASQGRAYFTGGSSFDTGTGTGLLPGPMPISGLNTSTVSTLSTDFGLPRDRINKAANGDWDTLSVSGDATIALMLVRIIPQSAFDNGEVKLTKADGTPMTYADAKNLKADDITADIFNTLRAYVFDNPAFPGYKLDVPWMYDPKQGANGDMMALLQQMVQDKQGVADSATMKDLVAGMRYLQTINSDQNIVNALDNQSLTVDPVTGAPISTAPGTVSDPFFSHGGRAS